MAVGPWDLWGRWRWDLEVKSRPWELGVGSWDLQSSDPELPEVMIDVAVTPEHPFPPGEPPEHRMLCIFGVRPGEAMHQVVHREQIGFECAGARALLARVDFRPRRHACR